jgi:hypothetical protein
VPRSAWSLPTLEGPASRAPIPEPEFPSQLYQVIWRNWELTNTDRMAELIGTTPDVVLDLGYSMGLPKKRFLSEDQLARIYITVIRQNWHVLPEDQIIALLGWDRKRFDFTLKEDDALDLKLGLQKPRCVKVVYHAPSEKDKAGAAEIRRIVQQDFGAMIERQGEDRFAFVKDLNDTRHVLVRDPDGKPGRDEIDLSRGWSISGAGDLNAVARRFAVYMAEAMNVEVAVGTGKKNIRLEVAPGLPGGRDTFRAGISPDEVRITGHDQGGVMQGLYWLQDQMDKREGPFLTPGVLERKAVWNPRYLYSYFALYGDPLIQTERDPFPDALLERLARRGINGVWIQAVLNTLAPSKQFPEFGAGSEIRLKNLNTLVRRAQQFGVRVYLYLNEPRGMPDAFFRTRQEMRGTRDLNLYAMCTSVPAVREWLADSLAHVLANVPDLGGIFCITMSENLTNCFSKSDMWGEKAPTAPQCPRCSKRNSWDVIGELIGTFREGVRRHSATADVIAWDWAWGEALSEKLIPLLPKDTRILSEPGGGEYMLSTVGAGDRSKRNWERAHAAGLPAMAKVQFNNTWEISAVPHIPVMHLILEHCQALARTGISGIVASWTCGGYPSPNLALTKAYYFEPRPSRDEILTSAAVQRYGTRAAPLAVEAWRQFSDAFLEFPFGNRSLDIGLSYVIPTQHGPSNALRLRPTGYHACMILFPHDDYRSWCGDYSPDRVQRRFAKMAGLWQEGLATLKRALAEVAPHKMQSATLDLAIAETCYTHFQSTANQLEFYMLRETASDKESLKRMREIAEEEITLAQLQFVTARDHSVIAYEASNHYYYTPLDLVEKVLNCRYVIREIDQQLRS